MRIRPRMHPRVVAWARRRGMDLRNLVHICLFVVDDRARNEKVYVSIGIYSYSITLYVSIGIYSYSIHIKLHYIIYTPSYIIYTHFPLDRLIYQNASGYSTGRRVGNLLGLFVGRLLGSMGILVVGVIVVGKPVGPPRGHIFTIESHPIVGKLVEQHSSAEINMKY